MARKPIGERAMTPAERQRRRRERQRAKMAQNDAAPAGPLEAAWRAAGADERQAFCDHHGLVQRNAENVSTGLDRARLARWLRDAVARSDADAKAGKLDSAHARLEATAEYVIARLEPAQSYDEASGFPASELPLT